VPDFLGQVPRDEMEIYNGFERRSSPNRLNEVASSASDDNFCGEKQMFLTRSAGDDPIENDPDGSGKPAVWIQRGDAVPDGIVRQLRRRREASQESGAGAEWWLTTEAESGKTKCRGEGERSRRFNRAKGVKAESTGKAWLC